MEDNRLFHGFGPHFDPDSKILILGSFPSKMSRKCSFYYMHPRNRFWQVLSIVYGDDFTNPDPKSKRILLSKHKVALYDVVESCFAVNSLDSSLGAITPTDIRSLIEKTSIKKIFLNGKKASSLFLQYFPDLQSLATVLPSTSATNAQYDLRRLHEQWKVIKDPYE